MHRACCGKQDVTSDVEGGKEKVWGKTITEHTSWNVGINF